MIDTWTLGGCAHVFFCFFFSHHMLLHTPLFSVVGPLLWKNNKTKKHCEGSLQGFSWLRMEFCCWICVTDTCLGYRLLVYCSQILQFNSFAGATLDYYIKEKMFTEQVYATGNSVLLFSYIKSKPKISAMVCTELHTFMEPCQPAWKTM